MRTYKFSYTYDSSPLVFRTKDGPWLVIAHEYQKARTVAISRDTGKVVWTSEANQPGGLFFGYSYYLRPDGSRLILTASSNGLHAMSGETGKDLWWVQQQSTGGITPCVDQAKGWIFYQCDGKVLKIRADDGRILQSVSVASPTTCMSWNTLLTNDSHGSFVATYWYDGKWNGAIRVYDKNLKLAWEKTRLPTGKKDTLTYADGKLLTGSGNRWKTHTSGDNGNTLPPTPSTPAKSSGSAAGEVRLPCILNVPYFNGFFYAEKTRTTTRPSPARCSGSTPRPASWSRCSTTDRRSTPVPPVSLPAAGSLAATVAKTGPWLRSLPRARNSIGQVRSAIRRPIRWPCRASRGRRIVPMREIGRTPGTSQSP